MCNYLHDPTILEANIYPDAHGVINGHMLYVRRNPRYFFLGVVLVSYALTSSRLRLFVIEGGSPVRPRKASVPPQATPKNHDLSAQTPCLPIFFGRQAEVGALGLWKLSALGIFCTSRYVVVGAFAHCHAVGQFSIPLHA